MHHFALIGVPVPGELRVGECSMAPGLSAAAESLLEVPAQDVGAGVHGRVICMGGVRDDNHARSEPARFLCPRSVGLSCFATRSSSKSKTSLAIPSQLFVCQCTLLINGYPLSIEGVTFRIVNARLGTLA